MLLAVPGRAEGLIVVRDWADVENSVVLVSDIAEVSGVSDSEKSRMLALKFCMSPAPDREIDYKASQVKGRLYNAGIDVEKVELVIPDRVTIHRKATTVTGDDIITQAVEYIKTRVPWAGDTLVVEAKASPQDIVLPYGNVEIVFKMDNRPRRYGVQSILAEIKLDGATRRVISLTSYLRVMADVVHSSRDVPSGAILGEDDLEMSKVDLVMLRPGAYSTKSELIGKQVIRALSRGDLITHSTVADIPDIKAGDVVSIVVQGNGYQLSATGKALEKGYEGESIRVLNVNSKKILDAIVVDSGTVEVVRP